MSAPKTDADKQWVMQLFPSISEDHLEWFLERIAIRCDSGIKPLQARNLTHADYLEKLNQEKNNVKTIG